MKLFTVGSAIRHEPPLSAPKISRSETESRGRFVGAVTFAAIFRLGGAEKLTYGEKGDDFFAAHFFADFAGAHFFAAFAGAHFFGAAE